MKTLWLLIAMLLGLQTSQVAGTETVIPTPTINQVGDFAYGLIKTNNINLTLIPNYADQATSASLLQNHNCSAAISGGFYGEDFRPLGLLIIDGQTLSRRKSSALFDGFLNIDDQISIGSDPANSTTVLQSGPLLIQDGKIQRLAITSDKSARRMIAATAGQNLFFLTVYNPQAEILGPYLADLPQLVNDIAKKENLNFDNAINLDGGRASAFYSPSLKLTESDPVGSLFCVK